MNLGSALGALNVFGLVVSTAAVGLVLVRGQGLSLLHRIAKGEIPSNGALVEGPLLVVAAICLFIPGFISDGLGALLLIPPLRRLVAYGIANRFGTGASPDRNPEDVVIVVRPKNKP